MANFTVVDWSTLSEITSTKMHQMMDNDQYLKDAVAGINTTLGSASITSDISGLSGSGEHDLTGLTVSITGLAASRLIKVTFSWRAVQIDSGDVDIFGFRIKADGSMIGEVNQYVNVIGAGMGGATCVALTTPASGDHTFQAAVKAQTTSSDTYTFQANSTYPAILLVEDAGPA